MRTTLILIIALASLFIIGDRLYYWLEANIAPERCRDFSSNIVLVNKMEDGRYSFTNGVVIGAGKILTVSHARPDTHSMLLVGEEIIGNSIEKVEFDPIRDLAMITTKENPGLPFASLSPKMNGPFTLVTIRENELKTVFAGNNWILKNGFIVFRNGAAIAGDSGAPLLNNRCEVVAIVHGGSTSFLWKLRPTSEYVPLFE